MLVFPALHFFSIPSLIGLRYAAWLIDGRFVVWSSARHQYRRISDIDVGSLDHCSYPHQEAINIPNTAEYQSKTARTRPKRRQQGPKRAPKRAQKESKKGPRRPGGASRRPKREHPRVGPRPRLNATETGPRSGPVWAPFWGPNWGRNRPKWVPERVPRRLRNLHDGKSPRRARKSAVRSVRGTPGEAEIVKNNCIGDIC